MLETVARNLFIALTTWSTEKFGFQLVFGTKTGFQLVVELVDHFAFFYFSIVIECCILSMFCMCRNLASKFPRNN